MLIPLVLEVGESKFSDLQQFETVNRDIPQSLMT